MVVLRSAGPPIAVHRSGHRHKRRRLNQNADRRHPRLRNDRCLLSPCCARPCYRRLHCVGTRCVNSRCLREGRLRGYRRTVGRLRLRSPNARPPIEVHQNGHHQNGRHQNGRRPSELRQSPHYPNANPQSSRRRNGHRPVLRCLGCRACSRPPSYLLGMWGVRGLCRTTSTIATPKNAEGRYPRGSDPQRKNVRRRPTLPRGPPRSTIGAEGLNFRVRNGTGYFPFAMATETLWRCQEPRRPEDHLRSRRGRPHLGNRTVDAKQDL